MGYKFLFITLAGWQTMNLRSFELARAYSGEGMSAYVRLQEEEFARAVDGYTAAKHQREVGTAYFDNVLSAVTQGEAATAALAQSTELEQFR